MFPYSDYFDLQDEPLAHLFAEVGDVWEVVKNLPTEVMLLTASPQMLGEVHPTAVLTEAVSIGEGTVIGPHVHITGPVYIGKDCEIRHGAFLRPNTVISDRCIVGHDTEVKASLFLTGSHAPHFAYVGDSILGRGVNLGAGTKLANFKLQDGEIIISYQGLSFPTGMRKLGAIVGDNCSIGCNAVLAPGTFVGKDSWVYSAISLRGVIPARSIVKPAYSFRIEEKR